MFEQEETTIEYLEHPTIKEILAQNMAILEINKTILEVMNNQKLVCKPAKDI